MLIGGSSANFREQQTMHHNKQQTNLPTENDPLNNYLSQDRNQISSRLVQEVASSALIDSLTAEWWSTNLSQTVVNDFLENLIPLVVLACEKVINEADERHLIETTTPDRSFNPINRLASFLMRNNPKYIHYSSLSPYHYAMKSLLNTKKVQVLKVYGEEETLLRSMLKQRQEERAEAEGMTTKEVERRKESLKILFHDWNVPERGWIQTKLVNNMLEQFNELPKSSDLKSQLIPFQSHRMHLGTFTENFLTGLNNQSSDHFDSIVGIYRRCAQTYTSIAQDYDLDLLLQRLFSQLDDRQSGYLFRQNVMKILQGFYDALSDQDKSKVNPPNQWPVIKQSIVIEKAADEPTAEPETASAESASEPAASSEQTIASTDATEQNEKKDDEPSEQPDEPPKSVHLELKPTSAYEPNYRFTKDQKPVYNLEHFDTSDQEKPIPYDEQLINKIQFSALLISFAGWRKDEEIISALIDYFRSNYKETLEERNDKKTLLQQRLSDAHRRSQSDLLFEKMNTACTGVIKLEPLMNYLKQYKDGAMAEQIEQVLQVYQEHGQLSSTQFFDLIVHLQQALNEHAEGTGEKFEDLLKYIDNFQPQLSTSDRTRVHTRQQWLKRIRDIPFRTLGQLYKEVIEIIQKDADTFGNQPAKKLSIYIALLENDHNRIRYVATTNDQEDLLLGQTLERGQGVSFQILENGKWTYITQTKNHSRLHFFDPSMKKQSGSFVLLPLKRLQRKTSNGLLGIDTIRDKKEKAFVQHEVQFYEGITSALADTLTFVDFERNMMKILQRFIYWCQQRCSNIKNIDYYTYEPISMTNPKERVLKYIAKYSDGNFINFETPISINGREQAFKYYLEHAASTCQSVITSFLGQNHWIQALRGRDNYCFAVIDTNTGEQEDLSNHAKQDLVSMYRCISTAVDELEQELSDDNRKEILTYEKQSNDIRLTYLFDRIWYTDICRQIKQITNEKLQEFLNQKSKWNDQVKQLLANVSRVIKRKEINASDYINTLIPAMIEFDPTDKESSQHDQWTRAEQILKTIDQSTWEQPHGDLLKLFYDWLYLACELHQIK